MVQVMLSQLLWHVWIFHINNLAGSEGGVSYNIGSLYGAGFFVCSFVVSQVIMVNKNGEPI